MSARELKEDIDKVIADAFQAYQGKQTTNRNFLMDALSYETKHQIEEMHKEEE